MSKFVLICGFCTAGTIITILGVLAITEKWIFKKVEMYSGQSFIAMGVCLIITGLLFSIK